MGWEKRKVKAFQKYHRAGGREDRREEKLGEQGLIAWCWGNSVLDGETSVYCAQLIVE